MIINRETPDQRHAKNFALVEKWKRSFAARRERLRPQWNSECEWHPWFAWFAVDVGTYENPQTAWLQMVERRVKFRPEMPTTAAAWSLRDYEYRERRGSNAALRGGSGLIAGVPLESTVRGENPGKDEQ